MARPTKQGIDYFPIDTQFDDKIELYILEKEANGLSVLITIWQLIYQNHGYYIENGKDLYLLIKKRINIDINEINSCINLLLERGIFDNEKHKKHKILTSKAVQKRYFEIAKKKKKVDIIIDYIINGIDSYENWVNVGGNATNVKEKVKEKVNVNIYRKFAHLSITTEEYEKLKNEFHNLDIDSIIDEIENYKKNNNYKSLYLTVRNWAKRRTEDNKKEETENATSRILWL